MFEYFVFDTPLNLFYGLVTGIVFGFLLQRARVTRFATIVGQFLLKDHTVLRTMLTAVIVGGLGVWVMHQAWGVPLHVKGATLAANVVGGVIFGVGMALLGYCPGTGVAALGDGSRHAIPGVIGMFFGAAAYAEAQPYLAGLLEAGTVTVEGSSKITFAELTRASVWAYWFALLALAGGLFWWLRGRGQPLAKP